MSRRSFVVGVSFLAVLACAAGSTLYLLVRHEPRGYAQAVVPPGPRRVECSREFYTEFTGLLSQIGDSRWDARFTDEQINSYLNEDFVQSRLSEQLLPEGISEPRVVFEPGRVRLAFRYGGGLWSTVISIDLRVWLPKNEPNVVALQLEAFHAGAMPISAQSLLERISEVCRQNGVDVNWYRHEGRPTALLRFQADKPQPTLQLRAVHVEQGAVTIEGTSTDAQALRTGLLLAETALKPSRN